MTTRKHANNFSATLVGAIDDNDLTIVLSTGVGLPSITMGEELRLTLFSESAYEIVIVTDSSSSPSFAVTRGAEGSTAQAWADGTTVQLRSTADSHDRKQDVVSGVSSAEIAHLDGVTSAIQTQLDGKAASLGADDNYVTDAEKTLLGNTSGTNTGDNATNSQYSGLASSKQDVITGLTASGAELNILDGATLTTTELNYVDGVTSGIQSQLDAKAASLGGDDNYVTDAEKTKLSNLSGTNTGDQTISDATITLTDVTTNNSSTSNHGFLKKLSNTATEYMNGAGNWSTPPSGGIDQNAYTTQDTSTGNWTLTVSSTYQQYYTGSTSSKTVTMPVTSTLALGQSWRLVNLAITTVYAYSSGGNIIIAIPAGCQVLITCILTTGTTAASWAYNLVPMTGSITGSGHIVLSTSPSLTTPALGTPSSGLLTSCGANTFPTASKCSNWGSAFQFYARNFIPEWTSVATAAATTTLTIFSTYYQRFTGSTTQTCALPVVSALALAGWGYCIFNTSSGVVTVQSSGGNTIQAMAANTMLRVVANTTSGTGATVWDVIAYVPVNSDITGSGKLVRDTSPTLVTPVIGAATGTSLVLTKVNGTEASNDVTASGNAGVITTSSLTTAASASYEITWTNTAITATSVILLTIMGGTNTTQDITLTCVPGAGTATLTIYNNVLVTTALNGTILIGYMVL